MVCSVYCADHHVAEGELDAEMIAANSPAAVQAVKRQVSATAAEHVSGREALDKQANDPKYPPSMAATGRSPPVHKRRCEMLLCISIRPRVFGMVQLRAPCSFCAAAASLR